MGRPADLPALWDGRRALLPDAIERATRKTRTGSSSERRVWKCRDCRKQFTVLTGTIFHGTKIPIRTWLLVIFDVCSARTGSAPVRSSASTDSHRGRHGSIMHRLARQ